jgi:hypothetical protein
MLIARLSEEADERGVHFSVAVLRLLGLIAVRGLE